MSEPRILGARAAPAAEVDGDGQTALARSGRRRPDGESLGKRGVASWRCLRSPWVRGVATHGEPDGGHGRGGAERRT